FTVLPFFGIEVGETRHDLVNAFRRDRYCGKTVRPGIVRCLTAQDHLEMRHRMVPYFTTDTVEADVGNMMLPAGVKAAANLNVQWFNGGVECAVARNDALAHFRCYPPGGENAQLTGTRPGAGGDTRRGRCPALPQPRRDEVGVERWEI